MIDPPEVPAVSELVAIGVVEASAVSDCKVACVSDA